MRKIFFGIIIFIRLFSSCASSSTVSISNDKTLDQAIAEAAVRIEERITANTKIALINFNSTSDRFSTYVLDELTANLVENGKLIVVDRSDIELIRNEIDFQYSGEVDDDSMQQLGRMLGAQSIVSGSLTEIDRSYRIVIRVLNVQTATVVVHYRTDINNDRRVQALLVGSNSSEITVTGGSNSISSTSPESSVSINQNSRTNVTGTIPNLPNPGPTITLVNNTGSVIYYVHISNSNDDTWGPDRLGSDQVVRNGDMVSLPLPYPLNQVNKYDFMMRDSSDKRFKKLGVVVTANTRLVFTAADEI